MNILLVYYENDCSSTLNPDVKTGWPDPNSNLRFLIEAMVWDERIEHVYNVPFFDITDDLTSSNIIDLEGGEVLPETRLDFLVDLIFFRGFCSHEEIFRRNDEMIRKLILMQTNLKIPCVNPAKTVAKYGPLSKAYLFVLQSKGFPVPKTRLVKSKSELLSGLNDFETAVIKPLEGLKGDNVYLYPNDDLQQAILEITEDRCYLVQEFIEDITKYGERSFMLIGDRVMYPVLKMPREGEFRTNYFKGGNQLPYNPTREEIGLVKSIPEALNISSLFTRIDLIEHPNTPLVLEVSKACPGYYRQHYDINEMNKTIVNLLLDVAEGKL